MAKTTSKTQTVTLDSIFGLLVEVRDGGQELAHEQQALTTRVEALESAKVTKGETKKERKARLLAQPTETEEIVAMAKGLIREAEAEAALTQPLVRCTAKTKATGKRCKVMSKSSICGLHRRAAEIAEAKAMAEVAPVQEEFVIDLGTLAPAKATKPVTKRPINTERKTTEIASRKAWNEAVMKEAGMERRKAILAAWAKVQKAYTKGLSPKATVAKVLGA